jgi:hypothetical protein
MEWGEAVYFIINLVHGGRFDGVYCFTEELYNTVNCDFAEIRGNFSLV